MVGEHGGLSGRTEGTLGLQAALAVVTCRQPSCRLHHAHRWAAAGGESGRAGGGEKWAAAAAACACSIHRRPAGCGRAGGSWVEAGCEHSVERGMAGAELESGRAEQSAWSGQRKHSSKAESREEQQPRGSREESTWPSVLCGSHRRARAPPLVPPASPIQGPRQHPATSSEGGP